MRKEHTYNDVSTLSLRVSRLHTNKPTLNNSDRQEISRYDDKITNILTSSCGKMFANDCINGIDGTANYQAN